MSRVQTSRSRREAYRAADIDYRIARINRQERAWQEAKADAYGRLAVLWSSPVVQSIAALGTAFGVVWGASQIG